MIPRAVLFSTVAVAFLFSSCSQNKGGLETAEPMAGGDTSVIPPWMKGGQEVASTTASNTSAYVQDDGLGTPTVSDSAVYSNTSPSVAKKTSTAKKSSSSKTTKKSTAAKKTVAKKPVAKKKPTSKTPSTYIVKKGDAIERIARKNGTTRAAIMKANGLKSDVIRPGQKLKIPKK